MQLLIQTKQTRPVKLTKEAAERIDLCESKNLCRFCKEPLIDGERVVRKCHPACDKVMRRSVERGESTDEEYQRQGLWGSPDQPGRKPRQPAI